jgi:hydrogenase expression/formation protein HypD
MAAHEARRRGLGTFSMLVSHVLVPPAMEAILAAPRRRVDGFLAAGHVCTVMGLDAYRPLAARHHPRPLPSPTRPHHHRPRRG